MAIQEAVYHLEIGAGKDWIRRIFLIVSFFGMGLIYSIAEFNGFGRAEAMDYAQLAREISLGHGYTTKFIRPVALAQMRDWSDAKGTHKRPDMLALPDTFNAPVYPELVAMVFRVFHPNFAVDETHLADFRIYPAERLIIVFDQFCFLASAFLFYLLGKRMFDDRVGMVAALVISGCNLLWQYAISGLPTNWIILLLAGFFFCLHEALLAREEERRGAFLGWLAGTGPILGLAILSHGSVVWLLAPYFLLLLYLTRDVFWITPIVLGLAIIIPLPWMMRNHSITGSFLGSNLMALEAGAYQYPGSLVLRSYHPEENTLFKAPARKFMEGLSYQTVHFFELTGVSFAFLLFLAGLFHQFRRPRVQIIRVFLIGGIVALTVGSSLVQPKPEALDDWNNLILLTPLGIVYGCAFFYVLMDRLNLELQIVRMLVIILFVFLNVFPLILALLPPGQPAFHYPPYVPPVIGASTRWLSPTELMMSDMPWATAWYGQRSSLWLPSSPKEFLEINDYVDRFSGVLLSPVSGDARLSSEIDRGEYKEWGLLIRRQSAPPNFPLPHYISLPPENAYLYFSDRVRWH